MSDVEDLNRPVLDVEDALSREYPPARPVPCGECPWRRQAAPGWLGPHTAEEWVDAAQGEAPIACHRDLAGEDGWREGVRQCAGAAAFRANSCKVPHNPTIAVGPERADVFRTGLEFLEHHER